MRDQQTLLFPFLGISKMKWMDLPNLPDHGSRWQHYNGAKYTVLTCTNEPNDERYPTMIVYQGDNGKIWSRRVDDWHRSMTLLNE